MGPRRRFQRTQAAIDELVYALEGARHALSALSDPDYFELHIADLQERLGAHPLPADHAVIAMSPPDPEFEAWDHRVRNFRSSLKTAMLFAACAMHNLLLAEVADPQHPPKRPRPARAAKQ